MRKIFTFILALLVGAGTIFAQTTASGTCGPNLTWDLTDGVLTISGSGTMDNYYNSSEHDISPWYRSSDRIKSVKIGDDVTSIGTNAFVYSNITSVTIGKKVETINGYAFSQCKNLLSVYIPNEVKSIGPNAFEGCDNLVSISIGESVTRINCTAFENCTNIEYVNWEAIDVKLSDYTSPFKSSVQYIRSFRFGSKVEKIPALICCNMIQLTSITIPNSVTVIEEAAFSGCNGATSLTIGENVTSIGYNAFSGCTRLASVVWNAKNCSSAPFEYMENQITSFSFGDKVESIPDDLCKKMSQLTEIIIPNSVTSIGEAAFSGCTGLQSITCNAIVPPTIENYTFYGVDKAIPVYIPLHGANAYLEADVWKDFNLRTASESGTCGDNITWKYSSGVLTISGTGDMEDLNPVPWADFSKLIEKVVIKDGVTGICASAFANCVNMTSIVLPNGITSVGQYAFSGCSSLTSLSLDEVESIPTGLCANCTALENVYIGVATSLVSDAFSGCSSLNYITASNENTAFSSSLGVLYNKDYTQLVKCPPAKGSYTFRSSVTSILPSAFSGCAAPFSVACDKDTPPALTSGNNLFADAIGTINVYVPEARINAYKAAWGTKNCQYSATQSGTCTVDGLNYEYYSDGTAKVIASTVTGDLVIPATFIYNSETYTVTEIGNAFYNCAGLTSVTIPVSVTKISLYAFQKCTGLQTVYCKAYNAVPSLSTGAFYDQPADLLIYVPVVLLDEYKTKWHGMTNIQPEPIVVGGLYYSVDVEDQNATVMQHPDGAGEYNPLLNVEIPKSINIYGMSFSVDSIGKDAFYGCDEIQSISLPNSVVYIDEYAFYECSALTSIYLPDGVTGIGQRAFWGCSGLTTITIPENVVTIGDWAFRSCTGFQFITCKAIEPPTCIYNCFSGVDKSITLYVPYESLEAYHNADEWNEFNIQPFDAPVGIDQINAQTGKYGTVKVLRNGQIFILHNGKTYTLQGKVVKQ